MNYIGSKYSLLDFIQKTICEITDLKNNYNPVFADLFAGTGVVGAYYRSKGYKVISNDIQFYSYILNKHYIENTPKADEYLLNYLNSLSGIED